ncbi:hypothetical protein QTG54_006166 [Skeletonema marinoi]|uniref:Uncharacterized protein n=1 Tax=Skeletonema marinoi TaxID=267567 RepID=A0AAD8YDL2_9STRA|nr:hypothetical protein QTG54_006166 [Skeletonema marinoi]|mmetsp:Transcript_592/g.934  ORF Transcript_592/g.934 Transcript_592/m.934 type:complete len:197 (-) Transcript_592:294-884(-)
MKASFLPPQSSALMFLLTASITACFAAAFSPSTQIISTTRNGIIGNDKLLFLQQPSSTAYRRLHTTTIVPSTTQLHAADNNNSDNNIDPSRVMSNDLGLEIIRGTGLENADEISEQTWEEIEQSAPSKLMVVKNLLGVNIFTYILAALIVFFLSMNAVFGVGWLGQSLGWEDVGTFTKVSESLPLDVDVSGSDYLL